MTPLLEQAFKEAQELPAPEQDTIAAIILEELAEKGRPRDLWTAIQKFRAEHDLSDLRVEEVFEGIRGSAPPAKPRRSSRSQP